MRLRAAITMSLALAFPAAAADSIADQAHAAYAQYAAGLSQASFLAGQYGRTVLKDVDGKWTRLNGPDNKTGIESYGADTDKACASVQAVAVSAPDPVTLSVVTTTPRGSFAQIYSLIAGSTFGEHVDTAAYLHAIGLGFELTSEAANQQRALALSIVNGIVQIYRPSDDILVLTRDRGYPLILARCPKSGG
jgi:hypothetical protein